MQKLSREAAEEYLKNIADFFATGEISSFSYIPEAIANHNWKILTNDGKKYVIKVLGNQTKKGIENHSAIYKQLQGTGITTSTFLTNPVGNYFYEENNITAVISPIIEGQYPTDMDRVLCYEVGKALAIFHKHVLHIPNPQIGWLNPKRFDGYLMKDYYNQSLIGTATTFVKENREIFDRNLPSGIIHADLFDTNMFVDSKNHHKIIAIFDFEESEQNLFILDIARSILDCCLNSKENSLNNSLAEVLVEGYSSIRPFTSEENLLLRRAIYYVAGITTFWFVENNYSEIAKRYLEAADTFI